MEFWTMSILLSLLTIKINNKRSRECTRRRRDVCCFATNQTFGITDKLSYKLPDNFKKSKKREYSSKSKSVKLLNRKKVKAAIKEMENI